MGLPPQGGTDNISLKQIAEYTKKQGEQTKKIINLTIWMKV